MQTHKDGQLNNSDIIFYNSLRRSYAFRPQSKSVKKADYDLIQKSIRDLLDDVRHDGKIKSMLEFLSDENSLFKDHIQLQLFKPEAKTSIGEKLLREPEIWEICLLAFRVCYKEQNKYNSFLLRLMIEEMQKRFDNRDQIEQVESAVQELVKQLVDIELAKRDEFISDHSKLESFQLIEPKEDVLHETKNSVTKDRIIQTSPEQVQENKVLQELINQQFQEIQEQIKDQVYPKRHRKSLYEKLMQYGEKVWKSECKLKLTQNVKLVTIYNIFELNGIISKEFPPQIILKVKEILAPNLNENQLHSIGELSDDNPSEVLNKGKLALLQIRDFTNTSDAYYKDVDTYKNYILRERKQDVQIYVPFNKYFF